MWNRRYRRLARLLRAMGNSSEGNFSGDARSSFGGGNNERRRQTKMSRLRHYVMWRDRLLRSRYAAEATDRRLRSWLVYRSQLVQGFKASSRGRQDVIMPSLEPMEPRVLLSSTGLNKGTLYVEGTSGDDHIVVTQLAERDEFIVSRSQIGVDFGIQNVSTQAFKGVKRIVIDGGDGDDQITVETTQKGRQQAVSTTIFGGAGDDRIWGGAGKDIISGGNGNDLLDGRAGADELDGGLGDDLLFGGVGNDKLIGGDGDDGLYGQAGKNSVVGGGGKNRLQSEQWDDAERDQARNNKQDQVLDGAFAPDLFNQPKAASADLKERPLFKEFDADKIYTDTIEPIGLVSQSPGFLTSENSSISEPALAADGIPMFPFAALTVGGGGEIEVYGREVSIGDGDDVPDYIDGTIFEDRYVYLDSIDHAFKIRNTGDVNLDIQGITISAGHVTDFEVISSPANTTLSAGAEADLVIRFDPTAAGTRSAVIEIDIDNASIETLYEFTVAGTATQNLNSGILELTGTTGDDQLEFSPVLGQDEYDVTLNGNTDRISKNLMATVEFNGRGGSDTALLYGSPELAGSTAVDFTFLHPTHSSGGASTFSGGHRNHLFGVTLSNTEHFDVWATASGTGLVDNGSFAKLHDTAGDDHVIHRLLNTELSPVDTQPQDYSVNAHHFDKVDVYGSQGGSNDFADLFSSEFNDHFYSFEAFSKINMPWDGSHTAERYTSGFEFVEAYGDTTGHDLAEFYDTPNHDTFTSWASHPEQEDQVAQIVDNLGRIRQAIDFEQVNTYRTSGLGNDLAIFYDTELNDSVAANVSNIFTQIFTPSFYPTDNLLRYASGYGPVHVNTDAANTDYDLVEFYGTAGDDQYRANYEHDPAASPGDLVTDLITNVGLKHVQTRNFEQANFYFDNGTSGGVGGNDTGTIYDLPASDSALTVNTSNATFTADGNVVYVSGQDTLGVVIDDGSYAKTVSTSPAYTLTEYGSTVTGSSTVRVGEVYTLSLSALNATLSGWTIDWGDGTIEALSSGAVSATHTFHTGGSVAIDIGVTADTVEWGEIKGTVGVDVVGTPRLEDQIFWVDQNTVAGGSGLVIGQLELDGVDLTDSGITFATFSGHDDGIYHVDNNGAIKIDPSETATWVETHTQVDFDVVITDNRTATTYENIASVRVNIVPNVAIPDADVRQAIRQAAGLLPEQGLLPTDVSGLTTLAILEDTDGTHDLTGIQTATNLASLQILSTDLTQTPSIQGVATFANVTDLAIQGAGLTTAMVDSWLATNFPAVQKLDLRYNQITNLPTSIAGISSLEDIYLHGNADLDPAQGHLDSLAGKFINLDLPSNNPDAATNAADLADRLYNLPLRGYEWVRNNIKYAPYPGAMRGAQATLDTREGNDWDTASLLREVLIQSGITAGDIKYINDVVDVAPSYFINYFGATTLSGADKIADAAGLLATVLGNGNVRFLHTWLELNHGATFYNLDASWKLRELPAERIARQDWIDPSDDTYFYQDTYLSTVRQETTTEYFEQQARAYLAANHPEVSLSEIVYDGPIIQRSVTELPVSYDYTVVTPDTPVTKTEGIPADQHHLVTIQVTTTAMTPVELLSHTVNMADVALSRITIAPQNISGDIYPTLYIDGEAVAQANAAVADNDGVRVVLIHDEPGAGTARTFDFTRSEDDVINVALNANQFSERYVETLRGIVNGQMHLVHSNAGAVTNAEHFFGTLMQLASATYWLDANIHERRVAELTGSREVFQGVESGLTTSGQDLLPANMTIQYPYLPESMGIDLPNALAKTVNLNGSAIPSERFEWIGLGSSHLEAAVWEELANVEGVSTVKLLQLAGDHPSISLVTLLPTDKDNLDTLIPGIQSGIRSYIKSQFELTTDKKYTKVIIPTHESSIGNDPSRPDLYWEGTGYIAKRANGGIGYIIHGGQNGGLDPAHGGHVSVSDEIIVNEPTNSAAQLSLGDPINVVNGTVTHDETDFVIPNLGVPLEFSRRYSSINAGPDATDWSQRGMGEGWSFSYSDRIRTSDNTSDLAGSVVWFTDTGDRLDFKYVEPTNSVVKELWVGIPGDKTSDIPVQDPAYLSSPITGLEISTSGDNYGERVRGYITAPTSGDYTFYISGDDYVDLWLSSSADPSDSEKIAYVPGSTPYADFGVYPDSQESDQITLEAGQRYYFEILHKEQDDLEHVVVRWTKPGTSTVDVIPQAVLSQYVGDRLLPPSGTNLANPQGLTGKMEKLVDDSYRWTDFEGNVVQFESIAAGGKITSKVDRYGNGVIINYDSVNPEHISTVQDAQNSSRSLSFTYTDDKISSVTDTSGRTWSYIYIGDYLAKVTPPSEGNVQAGSSHYSYYPDEALAGLLQHATDAEGRATKYEYYLNRRGFRVTSPAGDHHSVSFNYHRNTVSFIEERGLASEYYLNNQGNVAAVLENDRSLTQAEWEAGLRTATIDEFGQRTVFNYDDKGLLISTTDATESNTLYSYQSFDSDSYFLLTSVIDQGDPTIIPGDDRQVILNTYDSSGRLLTTTDVLGNVTAHEYTGSDGARGLVTKTTLPKGVATTGVANDYQTAYVYDADTGLLLSQTSSVDSATSDTITTQTIYDDPDGNASLSDTRGHVIATIDPNGNTTTFEYDLLGRLLSQTLPDPDGDVASGGGSLNSPKTFYAYDHLGRSIETRQGTVGSQSRTTSTEYDLMGRPVRVTNPDGTYRTSVYDDAGNLVSQTDELGHVTRTVYDERQRAIETILADGATVFNEYDGAGRIIAVTDARGNRSRFQYDVLGRKIADYLPLPVPDLVAQYEFENNLLDGMLDDGSHDGVFMGGTASYVTGHVGQGISLDDTTSYDRVSLPHTLLDGINDVTFSTWFRTTKTEAQALVSAANSTNDNEFMIYAADATTIGFFTGEKQQGQSAIKVEWGSLPSFVDGEWHHIVMVRDGTSDEAILYLDGVSYGVRSTEINALTVESNGLVLGEEQDEVGGGFDANSAFLGDLDGVLFYHDVLDASEVEKIYEGSLPDNVTYYTYDYFFDDLVHIADARGNATILEYDKLHRLTEETIPDPDGDGPLGDLDVLYSYDAHGNLATVTDARGHVTSHDYDELDRRISSTEEDPDQIVSGPMGDLVTKFIYDDNSNLRYMVNPLGATSSDVEYTAEYIYDNLNRKISDILPDPDDNMGDNRPLTQYIYNNSGDMVEVVDARGYSTLTGYDMQGRVNYVADALGYSSETRYDLAGNVLSQVDPLGNVIVSQYDERNRRIQEVLPDADGRDGDNAPLTTWAYDKSGNVIAVAQLVPLAAASFYTTKFEYDELNRVTALIDADGYRAETVYDALGNVMAEIDELGRVWSYTYDSRNLLITETDPLNQTTYYGYDANRNLKYVTDPRGDDLTNLSNSDWRDYTSWFYYDGLNREVVSYNALATMDGAGIPTYETIPADHNATNWTHYDELGRAIEFVDELGRSTTTIYDNLGRAITVNSPDPDGVGSQLAPRVDYVYDAMGNVLEMTEWLDSTETRTSWTFYDELGRPTVETGALGVAAFNGDYEDAASLPYALTYTAVTGFDALGRVASVRDPLQQVTSFDYDVLGQLIRETDPLGAQTYFDYDVLGNTIQITDRNGLITTFEYDRQNQLVAEKWFGIGADTEVETPIRQTSLNYDAAGQLIASQDLEARYVYAYDDASRLISKQFAPGQWSDNFNKSIEPLTGSWAIDDIGRIIALPGTTSSMAKVASASSMPSSFDFEVVARTLPPLDSGDNRNAVLVFDYQDSNNYKFVSMGDGSDKFTISKRVGGTATHLAENDQAVATDTDYTLKLQVRGTEAKLWVNGTSILTYDFGEALNDSAVMLESRDSYTAFSDIVVREVDVNGALIKTIPMFLPSMDNPFIEFDYTYDVAGNLIQIVDTVDGDTSTTYYTPDEIGRVEKIEQLGSSTTPRTVTFDYNWDSSLNEVVRKDSSLTNAVRTNWIYDGTGRLSVLEHDHGPSLANSLTYTQNFDRGNRIQAISLPSGKTVSYTLDASDQLTGADHSDVTLDDESYVYDENGNRITDDSVTQQIDDNNHLLNDGTYTYEYDVEGNRTKRITISSGAERRYVWDHANRLVEITDHASSSADSSRTLFYHYDYMGNLIAQAVDSNGDAVGGIDQAEYHVYDGGQRYATFDLLQLAADLRMDGDLFDSVTADGAQNGSYLVDDGTLTDNFIAGTPTYASGYSGQSLSLGRTSNFDHVVLPETLVDGLDDVTFTARLKTSWAYGQTLISGANATNANSYLIYINNSTTVQLFPGLSNGDTPLEWTIPSLADGQWHHFALVRDGTNNQATVYVDGVSYGTQSTTLYTISVDSGGLILGEDQDSVGGSFSTSQAFSGQLDDVRLYPSALASRDIATLINGIEPTTRYMYGPQTDMLLAVEDRTTPGGALRWTLADHQGSIREVTSIAGTVIEHRVFDSFGNLTQATDGSSNPITADDLLTAVTFTGQFYDADAELLQYRARWYDATVGRFLSEDPAGFVDGTNLSAYVNNSPVMLIDPSGLSSQNVVFGDHNNGSGLGTSHGGHSTGKSNPAPKYENVYRSTPSQLATSITSPTSSGGYSAFDFLFDTNTSGFATSPLPGSTRSEARTQTWVENAGAIWGSAQAGAGQSPAGQFLSGVGEYSVEVAIGLGEVVAPTPIDYAVPTSGIGTAGRLVGRALGGVVSFGEIVVGGGIVGGSGILEVASAGTASPVALPALAGGTALAAHGVSGLYNAGNLEPLNYNFSKSNSGKTTATGSTQSSRHSGGNRGSTNASGTTATGSTQAARHGSNTGSYRSSGKSNLRNLGLDKVDVGNTSFNTGRKKLENNGFKRVFKNNQTGRVTFEHPQTKAKVHYDPNDINPYTGKKSPSWHIEDRGGNRFNQTGRPVNRDDPSAHIPAKN